MVVNKVCLAVVTGELPNHEKAVDVDVGKVASLVFRRPS
jgi:hypothetical protein